MLAEGREGSFFCVHRLDRAVGGLMVYARNEKSAGKLSAAIAGREMKKEYLCVVPDALTEDEGVMRDLLFRDSGKNKSFVVKRARRGVKEAELKYRLVERREGLALVRVELVTGRSHQIRCQFASRKMPLCGDVKYGSTARGCPIALWSASLGFSHPRTGKPMSFSALPEGGLWESFEHIRNTREAAESRQG